MRRPETTLIFTNSPPRGDLGDCILHRTHHAMSQECWRAVLEWNEAHGWEADAHGYKAAYERAVLNDLTNQGGAS